MSNSNCTSFGEGEHCERMALVLDCIVDLGKSTLLGEVVIGLEGRTEFLNGFLELDREINVLSFMDTLGRLIDNGYVVIETQQNCNLFKEPNIVPIQITPKGVEWHSAYFDASHSIHQEAIKEMIRNNPLTERVVLAEAKAEEYASDIYELNIVIQKLRDKNAEISKQLKSVKAESKKRKR